MNDQELIELKEYMHKLDFRFEPSEGGYFIHNFVLDEYDHSSLNSVLTIEVAKLIKQYQALREIDIRIEELESFCGHSNEIPEIVIKARVKELQAQKDKLMEASK